MCVLTRDAAIAVLASVTGAPITRTIRGIRSEVEIGRDEGLPERCVITCDNVITVPIKDLDLEPVGHLDERTRAELDRALRFALDTNVDWHLLLVSPAGLSLPSRTRLVARWSHDD